jgi:predicted ferric reductase
MERLKTPTAAKRQPDVVATTRGDALLGMLPALVAASVGILAFVITGLTLGQAGGVTALTTALLGAHSAWYLSRASAFVSYLLLWWSMLLGLSITSRLARAWPGGPLASDLHEHASLLGLGFGVMHALTLLGDSYIGYTLPQVLIPFAGTYMTLWVGLGQVGLILMALVTGSFYVRRQIGAKAWRLIHFLSFAVFALALAHGLVSGTDASAPWALAMYVATGLSVAGLTLYRIVARQADARPHQRARVQ